MDGEVVEVVRRGGCGVKVGNKVKWKKGRRVRREYDKGDGPYAKGGRNVPVKEE